MEPLEIVSWNVAGFRAWIKKKGLDFIKEVQPDILCLQETKISPSEIKPEKELEGYTLYHSTGERKGYAGVFIYSKITPLRTIKQMGDVEFDYEGRLIALEFKKMFLINIYAPTSGENLINLPKRLRWDKKFQEFIQELSKQKPVIICGDFNVAAEPIDLAIPEINVKNAGFTPEERENFKKLKETELIDVFRHLNPNKTGTYTFWTYSKNARNHNVGYRLDYFLISKTLIQGIKGFCTYNHVLGSDHCPIELFIIPLE